MDATADLDAAAQLDAWLKKHVAEPRRTLARGAASNLSDYATCEEADLEDVLQISTWPPLARSRFLRAWRKLKGDEALTGTATVATQTDIVGAVVPVAAAAMPTGSSGAAAAADGGGRQVPHPARQGAGCAAARCPAQEDPWHRRRLGCPGGRRPCCCPAVAVAVAAPAPH